MDSFNSKQSPYFMIGDHSYQNSAQDHNNINATSLGRKSVFDQPPNPQSFQNYAYDYEGYNDNKYYCEQAFEMQIEDVAMARLKINEDPALINSHATVDSNINSRSQYSSSYDYDLKIESGEQINKQFKPELKVQFPQNQGKSIYNEKIVQLLEQKRSTTSSISPCVTPRSSKSQQKYERKESTMKEQSDLSSELPCEAKLAKNRVSAKNSRERKKIYFDLLEKKVEELQEENDKLREVCRNQVSSIDVVNRKTQKFQIFLEQQQQLFEKLETSLIKKQDNDEINIILDALRYRINANTQERNDTARVYFDSIAEVCLPLQAKYLLYASSFNKDFFGKSKEDYSEIMLDTQLKVDIQFEQLIKLKKVQSKIQSIKNTLSDSFNNIKTQIKVIQEQAAKLDSVWDVLKQLLNPIQFGSLMCSLYHNSFKQEIQTANIFEQLRNSQADPDEFQFDVEEQPMGISPKKVRKIQ